MISFVLILSISGCSDAPPEEDTVSETVIDVQAIPEEAQENAEEIINICIDLYEKAAEENKSADLEMIRSIVNRLGENGYPAVDSKNQINMREPEKVVEFCEKVDAQEETEITILEVSYLGGFVKYDLHTKDGNVDVVRSYYKYEKCFTTAESEKKALKKKNADLCEALKKSQQESTLKKIQEARLQSDYKQARAILDRIPPEIIRAYTQRSTMKKEVGQYNTLE